MHKFASGRFSEGTRPLDIGSVLDIGECTVGVCSFEEAIDYPGNDIAWDYSGTRNLSDCCQWCQHTPGCLLFAFAPSGTRYHYCWLKDKAGTRTVNANIITGYVERPGEKGFLLTFELPY